MTTDNTPALPWNHEYKLSLSIGYVFVGRTDTINPSQYYAEHEWNVLTESEKEEWLDDEARGWAMNYVEYEWSVGKNTLC